MTFRELEMFYYLCENPNISFVAKQMNISQSAISIAIKSLEKKLNEQLFDRIGKKLVLNERGRIFKEKTYTHFLALQDAKNIFQNNKIYGILNIMASKTIGTFIIPNKIFNFLETYPNVKIHKETANSQTIIKNILEGNIDIGFVETNFEDKNIIKQKIGEDELIIVSSDKSLANKSFYIDELYNKKWLLREKGSGTRDMFLDKLGEEAKNLNIFMEFSGFVEIKDLLKNKEVVTCISKYAISDELKSKQLFEIKLKNISFKRDFYMIYHKDKFKTKLFNQFLDFINK